jgi:UDP-2,3-diacylglucosamine pyrophosphatase LpxH
MHPLGCGGMAMDAVTRIAGLRGVSDLADFASSRPAIPEREIAGRAQYRTIWISDVHLGTRGCNAEVLIDFLDHVDSETLYLVGDMIDGWRLKKKFYWPASHNDVVWRILKRAKRGQQVVYIPGNHDEVMRQWCGLDFGGVAIRRRAIHHTADGRRLLVLHGDEFDAITLAHRWLAHVGDAAYHAVMFLNRGVNAWRRAFDMPYWSLSKYAKAKVKKSVEFISGYEEVIAQAAAAEGVDGVVCGHIHTAEMRRIAGVDYYNDGDWVEGCNALVEHFDGRMELLHWHDVIAARQRAAADDARLAA